MSCIRSTLIATVVIGVSLALSERLAIAQITSTFQPVGSSTDWSSAANWTNGVPNSPGDTANFNATFVPLTANLTAPITVGQLLLAATNQGSVQITGSPTLTLDNPGPNPALIRTQTSTSIQPPIAIVTGEQLRLDLTGGLRLGGGVNSSSGDITKTGSGQLSLPVASPGWNGAMNVTGGSVVDDNATGLGSAVGTTTLTNASLQLHVDSLESVRAQNSTITLWRGVSGALDQPFNGSITLSSGTLSVLSQNFAPKVYTVTHPIVLDGGSNTISPQGIPLRIARGVVGHGDINLNPSGTTVLVDSPIQTDGTVAISSGTVRFESANAFEGNVDAQGGKLLAVIDQHFHRIQSGAGTSSLTPPAAAVEALGGVVLNVDELKVEDGSLKGNIRTNQDLNFRGLQGTRTISNLISALNLNLLGGRLKIDDSDTSLGATTSSAFVNRHSEAEILLTPGTTTSTNFYLNDATGYGFGGALRAPTDNSAQPTMVLKGNIDLGSHGAYIGGDGGIRVEGHIFGGDLLLGGPDEFASRLAIVGGPGDYTGQTILRHGLLNLAESGRLTNTARIEVDARSRLAADLSSGDGPLADRIADNIPVELYGGELSAWPAALGVHSKERVASVAIKRGVSYLAGTQYFDANQTTADLVVGEITRTSGSLLTVNLISNRADAPISSNQSSIGSVRLMLEHQIPLVNGVLPAWIWGGGGQLMSYDTHGFVALYNGPIATLSSADETSIVRPTSAENSAGLANDLTIHALYSSGNLGLNGHALTVGSGGVFGGQLANGFIKPGQYANGELIFYGGTINASIVDNGRPTSVIYTGSLTVGGQNSYTGKTFVVGSGHGLIEVTKGAALPTGGDIDLSGGEELRLSDFTGFNYHLGVITLHDNSQFNVQCCGIPVSTVSAQMIHLESGRMYASLAGSASIVKDTDGVATLTNGAPNPGFTGTVDVYEGILDLGDNGYGYTVIGQSPVTVHQGGRLVLEPVTQLSPTLLPTTVNLAGGALYGKGTPQSDYANLIGTIEVTDDSQIYLFNGMATDLTATDIVLSGKIHVASGKALEVFGRANNILGTELQLSGGVHLDPGARLAGDGTIRGLIDISGGGILSPGQLKVGQSVGMLAMSGPVIFGDPTSTMIWGSGGHYHWEINDAQGDAGAMFGNGWDLMEVRGAVQITATPQSPFVLDLTGLDLAGQSGRIANLQSNHLYRWQILEAQSITGFDPAKFTIDSSHLDGSMLASLGFAPGIQLWLDSDGKSIFLNARTVPEPATFTILLTAAAVCGARKRNRMNRKPTRRSAGSSIGVQPRAAR
jgi:hypothetical protein